MESRTAKAMSELNYSWSITDHMLACAIDAINYNTYVVAQANSKRSLKRPDPFPRPESKVQKRQGNKFALMARQAHRAAQNK